ncbi:MAG: hypothetical protein KIS29_11370 [Thermoplasmata archaeon]|nr:hypothetical protein [Candidatus Sysuiplasma jiujiangense]
MAESRSGWTLILMGSLMLVYLLGALMIGQLGFAVFLGNVTAYATHMSVDAAITLWTGIYILATVMALGLGVYLETDP